MNNFDERAASWDSNPMHLKRSVAIAEQLCERISLQNSWDALEFGAGTGILGFLLAKELHKVVLMDTSQGMVEVMKDKVRQSGITQVLPVLHDLTAQPYDGLFHLICSQLVLHHINDIPSLLKQFYAHIHPEGYLAIADLYAEDGSFHGTGFDGHLGFEPDKLGEMVEAAGFRDVETRPCFVVQKPTETGVRDFPVFLLIARR